MTFSDPVKSFSFPEAGKKIEHLLNINCHNITKAAMVLSALNHQQRRQVIKTIHENKGLTVTQLYTRLQIRQSVVSQHLAVLKKAGIISDERIGKFSFYALNLSRIIEINQFAKDLAG